jgi:hypothetical protein
MIQFGGRQSAFSVNPAISHVREHEPISLHLDCRFAVVSSIVVVYDWGEQGNSADYQQNH